MSASQIAMLVSTSIITLIVCITLLYAHIFSKDIYKGIDFWIYGIILESIGFLLTTARLTQLPTILTNVVGNILVSISLLLLIYGTSKFLDKKVNYKYLLIITPFVFVGITILNYVDNGYRLLSIISCLYYVLCMYKYICLISASTKEIKSKYKLISLYVLSYTIIFVIMIRIFILAFGVYSKDSIIKNISNERLISIIISVLYSLLALHISILVHIRTIANLKDEQNKLVNYAYIDYLTKLPNRRKLIEHLNKLIIKEHKFALLFIDLNGFKKINDIHGHDIGDAVLFNFASNLVATKEETDFIARYGGDEFVITISKFTDESELAMIVESKVEELKKVIIVDNLEFSIAFSIGISIFPKDGETIEKILKKSDIAMYKDKRDSSSSIKLY